MGRHQETRPVYKEFLASVMVVLIQRKMLDDNFFSLVQAELDNGEIWNKDGRMGKKTYQRLLERSIEVGNDDSDELTVETVLSLAAINWVEKIDLDTGKMFVYFATAFRRVRRRAKFLEGIKNDIDSDDFSKRFENICDELGSVISEFIEDKRLINDKNYRYWSMGRLDDNLKRLIIELTKLALSVLGRDQGASVLISSLIRGYERLTKDFKLSRTIDVICALNT